MQKTNSLCSLDFMLTILRSQPKRPLFIFNFFFSSGCDPFLQKLSYVAFLHRRRCLKSETSGASDTMRLILKQQTSLETQSDAASAAAQDSFGGLLLKKNKRCVYLFIYFAGTGCAR